jgi:hypothetical protein
VVSDAQFRRIRRQGVGQLHTIAGILLDTGHYAGAQAFLEACILLNLAGYDGREVDASAGPGAASSGGAGRAAAAAAANTGGGGGVPRIRALALTAPGFQAFVLKLTAAMDRLGRSPPHLTPRDVAEEERMAPAPPEALEALKRITYAPQAPPRPSSSRSAAGGGAPVTGGRMGSTSAPSSRAGSVAGGAASAHVTFAGSGTSDAATARPLPGGGGASHGSVSAAGRAPVAFLEEGDDTTGPGPLVAGHAPWDLPALSATDLLSLTLLKPGPGSPSKRASISTGGNRGAAGGGDAEQQQASITSRKLTHSEAALLFYRSTPEALEESGSSLTLLRVRSQLSVLAASKPKGALAPALGSSSSATSLFQSRSLASHLPGSASLAALPAAGSAKLLPPSGRGRGHTLLSPLPSAPAARGTASGMSDLTRRTESVEAIIQRVTAYTARLGERPAFKVITGAESVAALQKPVQFDRPYMKTQVPPEARGKAMLAAIVHNAVQDGQEAMRVMADAVAAVEAQEAAAAAESARGGQLAPVLGSSTRVGVSRSLAGLGAMAVRSGTKADDSAAAAGPDVAKKPRTGPGAGTAADEETEAAAELRRMGYGASASPHPHVQDVELLAVCLGQLALLLAERLQAYVDFLQLQIARELAKAAALIAAQEAEEAGVKLEASPAGLRALAAAGQGGGGGSGVKSSHALLVAALRKGRPLTGATILAASMGQTAALQAAAGGGGGGGTRAVGRAASASPDRFTSSRRAGGGGRLEGTAADVSLRLNLDAVPDTTHHAVGANFASPHGSRPGTVHNAMHSPAAAQPGAISIVDSSTALKGGRRLSIAFPAAKQLSLAAAPAAETNGSPAAFGSLRGTGRGGITTGGAGGSHTARSGGAAAAAAQPQMADIQPQMTANKLLAVNKLAEQLDRALGPRHPALLQVGQAMEQARELQGELEGMGFLIILEETAGIMAVRRQHTRGRKAAAGSAAAEE